MKPPFIIVLVFLFGCASLHKNPQLIPDQPDCRYNYRFFEKTGIPRTIILVSQNCKKGYMMYFFDRDSSVWKANGRPTRTFEYRLVYDTTCQIKLTNAEVELFKNITTVADSLDIRIFGNLKKATGFSKFEKRRN